MSLDNYRKEIDGLDGELLGVLARRRDVLRKIGAYKKVNSLPTLDPGRKRQVLEHFEARARVLGLDIEFTQKLYELIHDYAVKIEEETP